MLERRAMGRHWPKNLMKAVFDFLTPKVSCTRAWTSPSLLRLRFWALERKAESDFLGMLWVCQRAI